MFRDSKNDFEDKTHPKSVEDEEKEGFFRNLFKEKIDNRRNNSGLTDNGEISNSEEKCIKTAEEEDKERFFRKFFKDVFEDRKDANGKIEENASNGEEEEASDVPLFQRLFRVHPEDAKSSSANENESSGGLFESGPGTQKFFGQLFRDHDRSIEDSELLGLKKQKEKCPGSPQRQSENSNSKPPLPNHCTSQFRKGAYHESLDFVHTLCETSFVLVDVFPIEDRKSALCESLTDINLHSRGTKDRSNSKEASYSQKLSKGGIPLANGDAFLQKPPPWACPLWTTHEVYRDINDQMSRSTAQAIDRAMTHASEVKVKFVSVSLSVETQLCSQVEKSEVYDLHGNSHSPASTLKKGVIEVSSSGHGSDLEWV